MNAVEVCNVCSSLHRMGYQLCLDCHGQLEKLAPFVYRCRLCRVKHGFQGGFGGSGHFFRSGQLTNMREGKIENFADRCVLSQHAPFQRWLKSRCS